MLKEYRELLKKDFDMDRNIKWILEFCEKYNARSFPEIVASTIGRFEAIQGYELGELYTAEDVLKLLDFLLNVYKEERNER